MRRIAPVLLASVFLVVSAWAGTALAQDGERATFGPSGSTAATVEVFLGFLMGDHDVAYYAEDAVFHVMAMPAPYVGREAIAGAYAMFYGGAFTDTQVEVRSVVADGNRIVLEFQYEGTNTGNFLHRPPTGQRVSMPMIGIYEIEGGYIVRGRLYYDCAAMLRQLGHDCE
jgi:steroid delta-isomerase-like uncharacterized protein